MGYCLLTYFELLEDGPSSNNSLKLSSKKDLDLRFGTWDSPNADGYRTTPDNWKDDINCTGVKDQCASDGKFTF